MADSAHHVKAAVDFLRLFPGRHALSAICPETKAIESALFPSADAPELAAWIAARNGRRNIYFTGNEPAEHAPANTKLKKQHIGRVRIFHADFDPAPDQPLEAERQRLKALAQSLGGAVVDSGGGFQALLPVAHPVTHEEAERINRSLAYAHGGDRSAWNVDRILRLPGTINLPDARKRAKGRTPAPAVLVAPPVRTFTPADFSHLPAPRAVDEGDRQAESAAIREAADAIAAAPWEAGDWLLIPAEARERLEAALAAHPRLAQLWRGEALKEDHDSSRSGLRFSLARECRQIRLTAPEFAHLVQCSPTLRFADAEMHDAVRQLSRAWARHDAALDPASWFTPFTQAPTIWDAAPSEEHATAELAWLDPAEIPDDFQPPPREWLVQGMLPVGEVTSTYGAGGVGKTLATHQLSICIAADRPWLGQAVRQGVVLALFGEDSEDELMARHVAIMQAHSLKAADLGGRFRFVSRRGMDNRLATFGKDGSVAVLPLWHALRDACLAAKERHPGLPGLLVLDTLADIFAGSEIERLQVNGFVKQVLLRLAIETGFAVKVLAHPSAAGEASGSGLSGSTHWSNAVRSRWYMRFPDKAANPNVRILEVMKNNYGPPSGKMQLEWSAGAFRLLAGTTTAAEAAAVPTLTDAAEQAVLNAFAAAEPFQASLSKQGNYAPKLIRQKSKALAAFSQDDIAQAMDRLLARGLLAHVEIARDKFRRPLLGFKVVQSDIFE